MIKPHYNDISLRTPTILDENNIIEMRNEFLNTNCKFNGTSNLDVYETYIDWLANTINQSYRTSFNNQSNATKQIYLAVSNISNIIGTVEIIFFYNNISFELSAHIIECIRPTFRRKGYGKPLLKKAVYECRSYGIKLKNITFERNSKASNDTMTKIMDF